MKYVLEFGNRGGYHTENVVLPSKALATKLAANLVMVFTNDASAPSAKPEAWNVKNGQPRMSWQSSTHFVSLSILDNVARGPASAKLWKKEG